MNFLEGTKVLRSLNVEMAAVNRHDLFAVLCLDNFETSNLELERTRDCSRSS